MRKSLGSVMVIVGVLTACSACTNNYYYHYATSTSTSTGTSTTMTSTSLPPLEMVSVSAGWFEMGQRVGESGDSDETPRHFVNLDAYHIGKHEVTNQEYTDALNWALGRGYLENANGGIYTGSGVYVGGKILLDIPSVFCQIRCSVDMFTVEMRDGYSMANHPVVMVSWYGSAAYCNWRSEMEGLTPCYNLATWELTVPCPDGYRLPTEAEWERAASWDVSATEVTLPDATTGKHWIYGFGSDDISYSRANYYDANPLGLTSPYTTPVGYYDGTNGTADSPSPVGCCDMSGNVWEWCHDRYGLYSSGNQTNPMGPATGSERLIRGGGWNIYSHSCRGANRVHDIPDHTYYSLGLRLVRPY